MEKITQQLKITGNQQGNTVILSWTLPTQNAPSSNILNIERIDIYRLVEPLTSTLTLSEEEFSSRSTLIATIPVSADDFKLRRMTFTDTLQFAGQSSRLHYAIRFVNASGQKAAFSNFLLIEPTAKVAQAPSNLNVKTLKDSIKLNWDAPTYNVDGSEPANILGYNIYRLTERGVPELLNSTPDKRNEFFDKVFEFEKIQMYFVRSVSLGTNGEPIESLNSNIVEVFPKDIYQPEAPNAVTIAAAPNNLSIFFAFNSEKDIAGYRIYRTLDPNKPKSDWTLLTPDLLTTNTFSDKNVESGKTYFYFLIAIDNSGNVSEPSEIVSETVP
ncbi:MAG: fibronectin type III domain-containing protein [Acidobacteria bacterium]|nr:fibronectin type III domain-containing protein [Acidobacteriota bacterium]